MIRVGFLHLPYLQPYQLLSQQPATHKLSELVFIGLVDERIAKQFIPFSYICTCLPLQLIRVRFRFLFLTFFLCSTNASFAQKLWTYAKENCMPTDLSQHTLLFPITTNYGLKYDYEKAKKIFKKYYPYKYAFVSEDSLKYIDSLSNYYVLRKDEVSREISISSTPQSPGYRGTYQTYLYKFTKGNSFFTDYKPLDIYSTAKYKSLLTIVRNLHYDIPSNKPTHCFKINLIAPIPKYTKIGLSYECLIQRKTSLGIYVEGGSWKYIITTRYMSSDFVMLQPQLIRYFNLFKNNAYDGLYLGIAPFLFYNKDHLNTSDPDVTESTQVIKGYGFKGMIGYQFIIAKTIVVGAWGGPQYRFNANNNYQYENDFLASNYSSIAFAGQVYAGFVLK